MTPEAAVIQTLLMIPNKEGRDVPFILNKAQLRIDEALGLRNIIPKARQEGVSSYFLARFTVKCLYERNTRAVVISHDAESTERLFARANYFLDNLRGPKAETGLSSKRELTFPKTNSMFYIGTAGARKFGRGDTITDLHGSEVAFWDDPKSLTAGLFQAVPRDGFIALESTGNGRNWYYRQVIRALNGHGRYQVHFLDWLSFAEYDIELSPEEEERVFQTLDPAFEEDILYHETGLSLGQIQFRREKLEEMDYDLDLFRQEYPATIEECFRASGRSIFHKINYIQTPKWKKRGRLFHILDEHPNSSMSYAIGADVSGGVGTDRSVAEIYCLDNMEQVGEWISDTVAPDDFAHILKELGEEFSEAYITVEANNYGWTTLAELREIYPMSKIHHKPMLMATAKKRHKSKDERLLDLGLYQTRKSKPLSIGRLRKLLATELIIHSPILKEELDSFIEHPNGQLGAEEGSFDDTVTASTAFAHTCERAGMLLGSSLEPEPQRGRDPFSMDAIIDELHGRSNVFPIRPQAGVR